MWQNSHTVKARGAVVASKNESWPCLIWPTFYIWQALCCEIDCDREMIKFELQIMRCGNFFGREWEWKSIILVMGMGVGIATWEWEGMGIKNLLANNSTVEEYSTFTYLVCIMCSLSCRLFNWRIDALHKSDWIFKAVRWNFQRLQHSNSWSDTPCQILVLQCFVTVVWVIWPVKIVPNMTYNVFDWTLNPTLLLLLDVSSDGTMSNFSFRFDSIRFDI